MPAPAGQPTRPRAKRARRSTEEVRERLLDAARELFLAQGYEATYTKDIAERAGVAEKVLYGNFTSKAGIFDAAFVDPFVELVDRYVASFRQDSPDATVEQRIEGFVSGLYDLVHDNRTVLRAVLIRQFAGEHGGNEIVLHLARTIGNLKQIDQPQYPGVDQDAATIVVAGMVFGVALLDDLLTPPGHRRPGRKRLEAEMTNIVLHGVLHRPPTPSDDAR